MNWMTGLQRAIDYVEEHILEDVNLEEAAAQSFSSSYHFQRVFSIVCDMTLGSISETEGFPWRERTWHGEK